MEMEIHAPYVSAHTSFSRQFPPHKTQTLCQFPLSQNPNQKKSHAIPTLPRQNPLLRAREFQVLQGLQTIGPFYDFTAIVGPNGSGKSNLIYAISFVLGVRAGQLRGAQLKDLIYAFDDEEKEQKGRRASVRLVYQFANSSELHFTRTITSSGGREYRIDGTTVTWDVYNAKLRDLGILVKASNFLVFQVLFSLLGFIWIHVIVVLSSLSFLKILWFVEF